MVNESCQSSKCLSSKNLSNKKLIFFLFLKISFKFSLINSLTADEIS